MATILCNCITTVVVMHTHPQALPLAIIAMLTMRNIQFLGLLCFTVIGMLLCPSGPLGQRSSALNYYNV